MPAIGEKGLREEIATALTAKWESKPWPEGVTDYEVIGTGSNETIIKWCGEIFVLTVRKI